MGDLKEALSGLLTEFVHLTPGDRPDSLMALAKAFIRHEVIALEGVHLGNGADFKEAFQQELSRGKSSIAEKNVLEGVGDTRSELAAMLEKKAKLVVFRFREMIAMPMLAMPFLIWLNSGNYINSQTLWMLVLLVALIQAALFYFFYDARQSVIRLETEFIRLKLLEARLEMAQQATSPEFKQVLYQIISQNLISDQQEAARMVIHNWGTADIVTVGNLHGNLNNTRKMNS